MQINIKTSGENQAIVTQLTKNLLGVQKKNVIARIALGYSLSTGKTLYPTGIFCVRFTRQRIQRPYSFDGQYRDFYIALICQAYGITEK